MKNVLVTVTLTTMFILCVLCIMQPEEAEGMKMGLLEYWFGD